MDLQKEDATVIRNVQELRDSNLFLGKEAYTLKLRIEKLLQNVQDGTASIEEQRDEGEKILRDSQTIKKGVIRFTAWRIQKGKEIVGIRMLNENILWDKGPYWYEDSPFWLSGIRGIIPIKEMKLSLDEEFIGELKQHIAKMNSLQGRIFEQGLWYFISLMVISIAYGFWKSNQIFIGGGIAAGCIIGCVVYLLNKYSGITISMERKAQFKSWIMPSGEINADDFLSMLQDKIDLWGPALETALKEVEIKI